MKDKKAPGKTPNKKRVKCCFCGKKKYVEKVELVFVHPILCPVALYACKAARRWYNSSGCIDAALREIRMYHETGNIKVH